MRFWTLYFYVCTYYAFGMEPIHDIIMPWRYADALCAFFKTEEELWRALAAAHKDLQHQETIKSKKKPNFQNTISSKLNNLPNKTPPPSKILLDNPLQLQVDQECM